MQPDESIEIRLTSWQQDRPHLERIRRQVFIVEQRVPESEEWDDRDAAALHVLAVAGKRDAVGTARLEDTGKIGRVAVMPEWRGRGIGASLVATLIAQARKNGFRSVHLNAQVTALEFYRRLGFEPIGAEFDEAGIVHRRMERLLATET
jgi:predicted GNAT family N-acyltransferase